MKKRIARLLKLGSGKVKKVSEYGKIELSDVFRKVMKSSPSEVKFTTGGAVAGLVGGGWIVGGSIGVVGFFGGIGIPIAALGLVAGSILGNRIGIARDKNDLNKRIRAKEEIFADLLKEQNNEKIMSIKTNEEHRRILFRALDDATDTLVILSGWATSYVVDAEFQGKLASCLQRGVNVYIGYGYIAVHESRPKRAHEIKAEANLKSLSEWCSKQKTKGLLIVKYYPNHSKLLICDEKFAVNGSFNWLSNSGRSQNEERSWVVFDRSFISVELDIVIGSLLSPLRSAKGGLLKKIRPWSRRSTSK